MCGAHPAQVFGGAVRAHLDEHALLLGGERRLEVGILRSCTVRTLQVS